VSVVIIVDIIHVLEISGSCQSPVRPRGPSCRPVGRDQIEHLLQGQVSTIVNSLRRSSSLKSLRKNQRKPIDQCATYLANHASYLNYPHSLAKGIPLHRGDRRRVPYLVKDRMKIRRQVGTEGGEAFLNSERFISMAISMRTGTSTKARSINAITRPNSHRCPRLGHPATRLRRMILRTKQAG